MTDNAIEDIPIENSIGYRGTYISLALDSNNHPHISFVDMDEYNLKYGYWNGTAWQIETVDYEYKAGVQSSITLDSKNRPHISYINSETSIKYAHFDGITWQIEIVDSDGGLDTSIALDSFDRPHICFGVRYPNSTTEMRSTLKYASYNGSTWNKKTFYSDVNQFSECTIKLDSKNMPHILVFTSGTDWDLIYFVFDGITWNKEIIQSGDAGYGPSMIIDSNDLPHICSSRGFHELLYIFYDGNSWHTEILDPGEGKGSAEKSIAIDTLSRPYIIYTISQDFELSHKYRIERKWLTTKIKTTEEVKEISFALDSDDRAHICYNNWTGYQLKYLLLEEFEYKDDKISSTNNESIIFWIGLIVFIFLVLSGIWGIYHRRKKNKDQEKIQ